ncbi:MAG: hypothetical protein ACLQVD_01640, partial [Capsulimonadaceae bacterium]
IFTAHTFCLEDKRLWSALQRAGALSASQRGRVVGCLILLALIGTVIHISVSLPIDYVFQSVLKFVPGSQAAFGAAGVNSTTWRDVIGIDVSSGISGIIVVPYAVCVLTVLYYDVRVRQEAFDIDLLAEDLGYAPLVWDGTFLPPVSMVNVVPKARPAPVLRGRNTPQRGQPPNLPPGYGQPPSPGYYPPGYPPNAAPPGFAPRGYAPSIPPAGYGQPAPPAPGYDASPGYGQPASSAAGAETGRVPDSLAGTQPDAPDPQAVSTDSGQGGLS